MYEREIRSIRKRLEHHKPFYINYHSRVCDNISGLYSFWLRGCCLYVGKSMDIKRRLYDHVMSETNADLEKYFKAFDGEIEVSYIHMDGITDKLLLQIEKDIIHGMRPHTNKALRN